MLTGGCLCGAVRYEAETKPYHITHCHCVDCRRSAGAAFVTWCSLPREKFRLQQGEIREVDWAGRLRGFCPRCGTSLTFRSDPESGEIDFTVSSLDQPELVRPADHIWVEDQLPWVELGDGLPRHARGRAEN